MIRKVNPETDAPYIAAINEHYVTNTTISFATTPLSVDEMRNHITNIASQFPYFVYETDGKVVGYCFVHKWKDRAAYDCTLETTIYLSPEYTGKGIAMKLMQRLIEACREQGITALIACITEGNEPSCAFHRKLGFKQVSSFKKVGRKFGKVHDVVDYELLL